MVQASRHRRGLLAPWIALSAPHLPVCKVASLVCHFYWSSPN
ncbi:AQP7 isoform 9 [Pongo abelii]|uniref:AQP7 isoform 9 n=1 Tax=Pongo abelii TaxID=9601 RepID=A0A2J8XIS0_PONAB|nr:AQP7 isoform 9 [Pongo abelii]